MAKYSPAPIPTSDLSNTQRFLREEFEQIRSSTDDIYELSQFLVSNYAAAGYGQVSRETPQAITLDATWRTLNWEIADFTGRGVQYVLPQEMLIEADGIWYLTLQINFTFAEAQAGRSIELRPFNVTDGIGGAPRAYFVGRNTAGATLPVTSMVPIEVDEGAPPEALSVQVRTPDSFSGVSFDNGLWGFHNISEYRGAFLATLNNY